MSNPVHHVTAQFVNGTKFEVVGEVIEDSAAIYVHEMDGGMSRIVLGNTLWVTAVPRPQSL